MQICLERGEPLKKYLPSFKKKNKIEFCGDPHSLGKQTPDSKRAQRLDAGSIMKRLTCYSIQFKTHIFLRSPGGGHVGSKPTKRRTFAGKVRFQHALLVLKDPDDGPERVSFLLRGFSDLLSLCVLLLCF